MLPRKLWKKAKKKKPGHHPPPLDESQILDWADKFHEQTGLWPTKKDSKARVPGAYNETWRAIDSALVSGNRGLPGGSSLVRLLAKHRGYRNRKGLPRLSIKKILAWADTYFATHGHWPNLDSEPQLIPGTNEDKWTGIDDALRRGLRGLPGGSSLAQVLSEHREIRNIANLPRLTVDQVLGWADAYFKKHGRWPRQKNWYESIPDSHGETWLYVDQALQKGLRGFP